MQSRTSPCCPLHELLTKHRFLNITESSHKHCARKPIKPTEVESNSWSSPSFKDFSRHSQRCVCFFTYVCLYLPIYLPMYLSIYLTKKSINLSVYLIHLPSYLFTYLSNLAVYLSIYLSISVSAFNPTHGYRPKRRSLVPGSRRCTAPCGSPAANVPAPVFGSSSGSRAPYSLYTCRHTHIYTYIHIHMCACMDVLTHILYMYVYMHICTYTCVAL